MPASTAPCTSVQPIKVRNQSDANDFQRSLEELRLEYDRLVPVTFSAQKGDEMQNLHCFTCQRSYAHDRNEACFGLLPNEDVETKGSHPYSLHIIHAIPKELPPYIHILNTQEHKPRQITPEILLFELAKVDPASANVQDNAQHIASSFTVEDLDLSALLSIQNIIGIFLCCKLREELRDTPQPIDIDKTLYQKNLEPVRLLLFLLQSAIEDRLLSPLTKQTNNQDILASSTTAHNLFASPYSSTTQNNPTSEDIDYYTNPLYSQSFHSEYSPSLAEGEDWQTILPGILPPPPPLPKTSDLPDIFNTASDQQNSSFELPAYSFDLNFEQIHSSLTEPSNTAVPPSQALATHVNSTLPVDSSSLSLNHYLRPLSSQSQTLIVTCSHGQPQYFLMKRILHSDLITCIESTLPSIACEEKTIDSILHKPYITLHCSETGAVKLGSEKKDKAKWNPESEPKLGFSHIHKDVYQELCTIHNGRKHPFIYAQSILAAFDSSIKFPEPKEFPDKENAELLANYLFNNNLYEAIVSVKEQFLIFLGIIIIDQAIELLKLPNSQDNDKQDKKILPKRLVYSNLLNNLNHRPSLPFTINAIEIALEQYLSQSSGVDLPTMTRALMPIEQQDPLLSTDIINAYLLTTNDIKQVTTAENDFTVELPEQITALTIKAFLQKTEKLPQPPPNTLYVPCIVFQPLAEGMRLYTTSSNNFTDKKIYMIVVSIHIDDIANWNTISSSFTTLESMQPSKLQAAKIALTFFCPHLKDIDTNALEDAYKNIFPNDRKTAQQRYYFQYGIKAATKLFRKSTNDHTSAPTFIVTTQTKLSTNIRDRFFQEQIDISNYLNRQVIIDACKESSTSGMYFGTFFNSWSVPEPVPKRKYRKKALPVDHPTAKKIQKT